MLESHLDYLSVVGKSEEIAGLEAAIESAFGTVLPWNEAKSGTRGKYYEKIVNGHLGIELCLNRSGFGGQLEWRLVVPGQAFAAAGSEISFRFARYLHEKYKTKCTRLDWAIDDFDHTLSVPLLHLCARKEAFKGADTYVYYGRGQRGKKQLGETIYLGSEQSEKRMRAYDKNHESKGEIDCFRVEYQNRDNAAKFLFLQFVNHDKCEVATQLLNNICLGFFKILETRSSADGERALHRLWQKFVDKVGIPCKVSIPREPTTISEKEEWIESQVIGTLTLLSLHRGYENVVDWIKKLIARKSKLSIESIRKTIESLKRYDDNKCYSFEQLIAKRDRKNCISTA